MAGQIDAETASPDQFARVGKVVITKSWLLVPKTYGLTIRRLGDAVWAYKSMTQRRVNGIPTGKTHAAVCYFTDGTMETVPARTERAAEELVMAIQQRAPWLLVGYDPQVESLWWLKRGEVLATLEERRKHLVGQVGGNSAPS